MSKVSSYVLSDIAESDVSDIYDYTVEVHSQPQAVKYLTGLEDTLASLVEQPGLGRQRPEIRQGLHSFLYEQHVIFYRAMQDHLRIVRILHAKRDLPAYFKV